MSEKEKTNIELDVREINSFKKGQNMKGSWELFEVKGLVNDKNFTLKIFDKLNVKNTKQVSDLKRGKKYNFFCLKDPEYGSIDVLGIYEIENKEEVVQENCTSDQVVQKECTTDESSNIKFKEFVKAYKENPAPSIEDFVFQYFKSFKKEQYEYLYEIFKKEILDM